MSISPDAGRKTPMKPGLLRRIDELTDGIWRIMLKAVPDSKKPLELTAIVNSTTTLAKFDFESDNRRWNFKNL